MPSPTHQILSHSSSSGPHWLEPSAFIATCGGIGRIPFAPGTWGASAGVALSLATGLAASRIASSSTTVVPGISQPILVLELFFIVILNLVGIPLCTRAERFLGRGSDPGAIVYDEMASLPLGLLVVPFAERSPLWLLVAFLLHRVFDIFKPFPCRQLEHLPAGLGIMADDWGAAAWMATTLIVLRSAINWAGWL